MRRIKISDLKKITESVQKEADKTNVKIIAGDTKVVEKGKADGIYLTTTGIGFLPKDVNLKPKISNSEIKLF